MKLKALVTVGIRRVLCADKKYYDIIYMVMFFAFVLFLMIMSHEYSRTAAIFPLVIGSVVIIMMTISLALQISSRASTVVERLVGDEELDIIGGQSIESVDSDQGEYDTYASRKMLLSISGWIIAFTVLTYLIGFTISVLLFLIIFYKVQASDPWIQVFKYTFIIWGFYYVVFVIMLSANMFEGVLCFNVHDYSLYVYRC